MEKIIVKKLNNIGLQNSNKMKQIDPTTKNQLIEGNKNIAVFMGAKDNESSFLKFKKNELWIPYYGICRYDTIELGMGKTICYHSSWDWLMQVIEKIENEGFSVLIGLQHDPLITRIILDQKCGEYIEGWGKTKIEGTYHAVLQFIKYLNQK